MKNLIDIPLVILLATIVIACETKSKEVDRIETSPIQTATAVVEALDTPEDEAVNTIRATGYIDVPPENRAKVSPYYSGFVKEVRVLPGQSVKKGEVLFTLENPEYLEIQQAYLEAKGQLDYLKTDYERQKQLADEKIASTKNFKQAESSYKVMQARYHSFKEQIRLMGFSLEEIEAGKLSTIISIKAPMNGNITSVSITKSQYADAMEVALELVNLEHIHLELEVFEKDALRIKEGQLITFKIPEVGAESYQGEVYLVGKSIDSHKRTVLVHGHIDDEVDGLIPGMFMNAMIHVD